MLFEKETHSLILYDTVGLLQSTTHYTFALRLERYQQPGVCGMKVIRRHIVQTPPF